MTLCTDRVQNHKNRGMKGLYDKVPLVRGAENDVKKRRQTMPNAIRRLLDDCYISSRLSDRYARSIGLDS
ncbi:MAG TPA: hypothetical protein VEH06_01600 [Candidatus Bathyarchaeia archaeon]|nr:hypothetical protein [Candidatus Bathyarchaeia archaeon]